ncbi:MAG: DUF1244 domain-containing protein [Acidobacteriota bacterium]
MSQPVELDPELRTQVEAQAFRTLLEHLQRHPEVQNIDLMNLGYFCRNCLSKWYVAAARDHGAEVDYDQAREIVYGMPYSEYKKTHQEPASPEQLAALKEAETKATKP